MPPIPPAAAGRISREAFYLRVGLVIFDVDADVRHHAALPGRLREAVRALLPLTGDEYTALRRHLNNLCVPYVGELEEFIEGAAPRPPVPAGVAAYLADAAHAGWKLHYFAGDHGGALLGWNAPWAVDKLPPGLEVSHETQALRVVLADTEDGNKLYVTWHAAAYDNAGPGACPCDGDWNPVYDGAASLQSYFYAHHFCPCHRKGDAARAGFAGDDGECAGRRLLVHEVTAPGLPGLVLYSETRTAEELEEELAQHRERLKEKNTTADTQTVFDGVTTYQLEVRSPASISAPVDTKPAADPRAAKFTAILARLRDPDPAVKMAATAELAEAVMAVLDAEPPPEVVAHKVCGAEVYAEDFADPALAARLIAARLRRPRSVVKRGVGSPEKFTADYNEALRRRLTSDDAEVKRLAAEEFTNFAERDWEALDPVTTIDGVPLFKQDFLGGTEDARRVFALRHRQARFERRLAAAAAKEEPPALARNKKLRAALRDVLDRQKVLQEALDSHAAADNSAASARAPAGTTFADVVCWYLGVPLYEADFYGHADVRDIHLARLRQLRAERSAPTPNNRQLRELLKDELRQQHHIDREFLPYARAEDTLAHTRADADPAAPPLLGAVVCRHAGVTLYEADFLGDADVRTIFLARLRHARVDRPKQEEPAAAAHAETYLLNDHARGLLNSGQPADKAQAVQAFAAFAACLKLEEGAPKLLAEVGGVPLYEQDFADPTVDARRYFAGRLRWQWARDAAREKQDADLARLRAEYVARVGDPDDPAFKAKLDEVVQALLKRPHPAVTLPLPPGIWLPADPATKVPQTAGAHWTVQGDPPPPAGDAKSLCQDLASRIAAFRQEAKAAWERLPLPDDLKAAFQTQVVDALDGAVRALAEAP